MSTNPCPKCNTPNRSSARFCANCGETLLSDMPKEMNVPQSSSALKQGDILQNRYRIEDELGRGGFGAVYRAWDANLNKPCAVKENLNTTPEAQRQFAREATVLASLTHTNLPRVTDHFSLSGQGQYLVMDFVDGEDLGTLIVRQGPVAAVKAIKWINQVADALAYLHSRKQPVVHRDIKPSNIRITPEGRAVLVDFGLVKLYNPQMKTTIGARAVTPGFAPPEQYGRGKTDARTDIYALGATLYALVTGQEPLESVSRMAGDPFQTADKLAPHVEPHISKAIDIAMQLEPIQRFQSVEEFKTALNSVAPVSAPQPPIAVVKPTPAPVQRPRVQQPPVAQQGAGQWVSTLQTPVSSKPNYHEDAYPSRPSSKPKKKTGRNILILGLVITVVFCVGAVLLVAGYIYDENQQIYQLETSSAKTETAWVVQKNATAQVEAVTQTASARIKATQMAQVTQTAQVYQNALQSAIAWPIVFSDSFYDNANEWYVGNRTGDYAEMSWTIGDGIYLWDALAYKGFVWWVYPSMEDVWDFYIAADLEQTSGPADGEQGLMFRHEDDKSYYIFQINNAQQYAIYYYDSSEWEALVEWTDSPTLLYGQPNRLVVIAQGSQFLFYINNQYILELIDSRNSSGKIGFMVSLSNADERATWEFSDFELRSP
ncbi:protein kinase [Chloroflexota bacterium]